MNCIVQTKPLKVCFIVSFSKNFQRQIVEQSTATSNGINILAGDDPVPVKFGPKGTDPQEGCAFHVSHAARCAVSDGRPCCNSLYVGIAVRKWEVVTWYCNSNYSTQQFNCWSLKSQLLQFDCFIRPPDILSADFYFTTDSFFFLSSSFLSSALRARWEELNENRSPVQKWVQFENACLKSGVSPCKSGAQKPPFSRISQLNRNFSGLYL